MRTGHNIKWNICNGSSSFIMDGCSTRDFRNFIQPKLLNFPGNLVRLG
jgi:hypothetical protein